MYKRITVFIFILIITFFSGGFSLYEVLLYAQETQPEESTSRSQQQEPAQDPLITKKDEITFNFDDEDVFSVIQTIFGDILKVNYIIDSRVAGRVNLRTVTPVAKEDVLPLMEVILRLNGIGIVEENNLYRIVPISGISKEPTTVGIGKEAEKIQIIGKALLQVVPLNYTSSSEMVRVLTPFASPNAVIVDVPKSNHIIIVDTDANIKRLLQLIEVFDREQINLIKPHAFVYPVQNSKATDVASLLQQIFLGATPSTPARPYTNIPATPEGTAPPPPVSTPPAATGGSVALVSDITRIFPDAITNSIIILSTPEDYTLIAEIIKKIDIVPRQVLIEGLIARVDLSDSLSFGLAWSLISDVKFSLNPFNRDFNLSGEMGQSPSSLADSSGKPATLSGAGFTFLASDATGIVRARLEALASEGKVKVMASPHILVSDNREASIQIGQQVPIKTSQTTPGGITSETFQYKDLGIMLKVKPQVNENGLVSLEITQEVSSSAATIKEIQGGTAPVINRTEAKTYLVVQNGETIIIGGLMREDTDNSRSGIPLLSKIPILGYLFGSTSKSVNKTELVILLTPHVIKNQAEASGVTSTYINKFKGVTKDKKIDEFIEEKIKE